MQSYPINTSYVPYTPVMPAYPYPYHSSVLEFSTLQNSYTGFSSSTSTTNFSLKSEDRVLDEEIMKYKLERLSLLEKLRELETMYNNDEDSLKEEEDDDLKFVTPGSSPEDEKKTENRSHSVEDDEAFARKLLLEERRMISEGAKTQNRVQQDFESGMDEILNDGELSQDLTQLEKDAKFAAQLEKIFQSQQQNQIEEDERIARYLADQDYPNNRNTVTHPVATPKPIINNKKRRPFLKPVSGIITMNKTTPHLRSHAVVVHNNYCDCHKIDAGNNGHIFKTHDQYCNCTKLHVKF